MGLGGNVPAIYVCLLLRRLKCVGLLKRERYFSFVSLCSYNRSGKIHSYSHPSDLLSQIELYEVNQRQLIVQKYVHDPDICTSLTSVTRVSNMFWFGM
jgi:hypothetical protein